MALLSISLPSTVSRKFTRLQILLLQITREGLTEQIEKENYLFAKKCMDE